MPLIHSIEGVGKSNASSNSGGLVFLGTIPGSLPEVRKRNAKSCMQVLHGISFHFQIKKGGLIMGYRNLVRTKRIEGNSIMSKRMKYCNDVYIVNPKKVDMRYWESKQVK